MKKLLYSLAGIIAFAFITSSANAAITITYSGGYGHHKAPVYVHGYKYKPRYYSRGHYGYYPKYRHSYRGYGYKPNYNYYRPYKKHRYYNKYGHGYKQPYKKGYRQGYHDAKKHYRHYDKPYKNHRKYKNDYYHKRDNYYHKRKAARIY